VSNCINKYCLNEGRRSKFCIPSRPFEYLVMKLWKDWQRLRTKCWENKGKGKVIPLHAMETHGVRGGTAPAHS
jgi:hypothetical protein